MRRELLEVKINKSGKDEYITYNLIFKSYIRVLSHSSIRTHWCEQKRDEFSNEEHIVERASLYVDGVGFFKDRKSFIATITANGGELVSSVKL